MTPSTQARLARSSPMNLKNAAGACAARCVGSGMRLGLGTGSTVAHFLASLGRRIARGEVSGVVGVPTSVRTERAARELEIPLGTLDALGALDLAVDGADEVDPQLNLVKGLGGALLREKIVVQASKRMLVIADEGKLVGRLGERVPLPVEAVPFGCERHLDWFRALGADPSVRVRKNGEAYRTDNGNVIIDCSFPGGIDDPAALEERLARRAGVVASGLFLGMADEAIIAGSTGIRRMSPVEP